MSAEREKMHEKLHRILDLGRFRKVNESVDKILFGNEVVTYMSPSMKLRLVKDRGRWSMRLGPVLRNSRASLRQSRDWYDLEDVLSVAAGRSIDLQGSDLDILAERLLKDFPVVLDIFSHYDATEGVLKEAAGNRSHALMGKIFPDSRLEKETSPKARLVEAVQKQLGSETSKEEAERAVTAVINAVKVGVKKDKMVQLVGFGTFKVVETRARKGVNPKTLRQVRIPKAKTIRFVPGKDLESEAL
jgi:DNA-binding protein HU-beta